MSQSNEPILVTKAFLPPLEEYQSYLAGIWDRVWLTNHGPLVLELEEKLRNRTGVSNFFFLNNGTIALQIAIKALDLKGQIITTPFSYVATTSSIVWEHCTPVFVDIEPDTLTIDASKIEAAITPETSGIIATHVYGNPCDVEAIEDIAKRNGLSVIYDAAHAFDVNYKGKPLLQYGDVSTLSFHATKLFHTTEGGAVVSMNDELAHKLAYMRNFGHNGPEQFWGLGINGKNSEFHAAMGLSILPYVNDIIAYRKQVFDWYDRGLQPVSDQFFRPALREGVEYNYAYYPIVLASEEKLLKVKDALVAEQIHPRRYFYPSLNKLPYVSPQTMPVTEDIASRVLCLPMYYGLKQLDAERVTTAIVSSLQ